MLKRRRPRAPASAGGVAPRLKSRPAPRGLKPPVNAPAAEEAGIRIGGQVRALRAELERWARERRRRVGGGVA